MSATLVLTTPPISCVLPLLRPLPSLCEYISLYQDKCTSVTMKYAIRYALRPVSLRHVDHIGDVIVRLDGNLVKGLSWWRFKHVRLNNNAIFREDD